MRSRRAVLVAGAGAVAAAVAVCALLWSPWLQRAGAVAGSAARSAVDRSPESGATQRDPRLPKPAQVEFDREALRAQADARRGYGVIPSARADLEHESLRDVVERLKDRAATDAAANRQIADILFECETMARARDLGIQGADADFVRRVELATRQCAQLDPALGNSADRLLIAARAGDTEARRRLRNVYNRLSGGAAARREGRELALVWLKDLARSGDAMAVLALADEANSGHLLPRDPLAAYAYYEMALPGLPTLERRGAEYAMRMLRATLTADELRQAKARENATLFD